ncbi:MAG: hypothetical protein ACI4I5_09790 [Acutalibacteraceae bacterium]
MLLKRILIGILSAVIAAGGIFYGVTYRFFDKPLTQKAQEAFEEQISLPDNFILAASSDCYNDVKNTMQAVHDSVNSGAYAIELDVSFAEDSTPYLAEGSDYITEVSVPLEKVFEKYAGEPSLRYVLHVMNFRTQEKLLALAQQYDLLSRILLTGFSREDLELHAADYGAFPIAADLDVSFKDLHDVKQCRELLSVYRNNGAGMLLTTADTVTAELQQAILGFSVLPLAIRGVESKYDMYYALSLNPRMIITDRPDTLYSILFDGDHMNFEHYDTF